MTISKLSRMLASIALAMVGFHPFAAAAQSSGAVESAVTTPARPADAPQRAVSDFYVWYLGELQADRDPLNDQAAMLSAKVSRVLVREIRHARASPDGLEADYFIQAQDYANDWLGHVAVRVVRANRDVATTAVDLGLDRATQRRLSVTLVREDGRWKLRRVIAR